MIRIIPATLTLDTSAYASADVLADTQLVDNALPNIAQTGLLRSVTLIDADDQGVAMTLFFFDSNVSLGTENSAASITDANALFCLGRVPFLTTDYTDLGGVRVATVTGLSIPIKNPLYVAALNGSGTPTFTATGVTLRLGIEA